MSTIEAIELAIPQWAKIYEGAQKHLKVTGNLVEQAAELPAHLGYYDEVYREIYNVRKRLDADIRRKRGELFRFYTETYARALSTRDIDQYINSDEDFIALDKYSYDVTYWENRFESLVGSLNSKNWMIGHITKLYVSGMDDIDV